MKIKRNKKTYHSKILSFDVICFFYYALCYFYSHLINKIHILLAKDV